MAVEYITVKDASGATQKVAADLFNTDEYAQVHKAAFGSDGTLTLVEAAAPMPVTDAAGATQTTLAAVLAKLTADPATQTTLAAVLAKLSADPATATGVAAVLAAVQGVLSTKSTALTSATPAQIASSATAVTLQASNAARRSLIVFNDSTSVLYLRYGGTASSTSYTVKVAAGGYWEMPLPAFTGAVSAIWASANGFAYVTEGT